MLRFYMDTPDYRAMVKDLLRELCINAYWYGEDTGDYDMTRVHEQDWFKDIVRAFGVSFE